MASRSHKYITRLQKRERGIPLNIWDAARSLQERRVASGMEKESLRTIIKDPVFRENWNTYRQVRRVRVSEIDSPQERRRVFLERVHAAEYWGWWREDDDGNWRYVS